MTNSAKQGTAKARAQGTAATAEAEPAAGRPASDGPAESAAADGGAGPAAGPAAADGADGAATPTAPGLDETKRRFREALERKNQGHSDGQGAGGREGSRINGAHGPAASKRSFRRKSG